MKKFICLCVFAISVINCATSNEAVFDPSDASNGDSAVTCNLNSCPIPPITGTIKCCVSPKSCGYKTSEAGTCYVFDAGSDGSSGSGGSSN